MSLQDFQILNKLGDGTYSTVFKAKRISDGQDYAIKKVKMAALSEKEKLNALNEVRLLASINNPYIVGFKEVFFEDNTTLCVVMEYVGGGDLHHGILKHTKANTVFKEKSIWRYAIQMILGLKTLHDKMILHRDLKCANVFLSKDEKCAKLGDLNVSKVVKNALAYTQTGTPYYASPEVWRDEPYDAKSDIWSLGCVIYEICALKPPFRANDMPGLFKKVQKGAFEKIPSAYSQDLFTLISLCLQVSPAKRLSCDQLLEHPVVQRNSQDILTQYDETEETLDLLHTIRIPKNAKNLRALRLHLPKSNYKEHVKSAEFNSHHQRVSNIKDFQLAEQHSTILEKLITSKDSENEIKNSPKSVVLRKNKTPFESPKDADRKEQLDKIYREHRDLIKPIKSIEIPMPSTKRARKGLKLVDQSLRGQRSEAFIEEGLREKKVKSLLQEQKSAILQSHILERNSRLLDDRDEEDRRQSVNRNKSKGEYLFLHLS